MNELVVIVAGESEGTAHFARRSKKRPNQGLEFEFAKRNSAQWRLSDLGIEQARTAGVWIRSAFHDRICATVVVTEEVSVRETALLVDIPEASYLTLSELRTRDWGVLQDRSEDERRAYIRAASARRVPNGFYVRPDKGGESMADMCQRVSIALMRMESLHARRNVIVCGVKATWALRVLLEGLSSYDYAAQRESPAPEASILAGEILWYRDIHGMRSNDRLQEFDQVFRVRPKRKDEKAPEWSTGWKPIPSRLQKADDLRGFVDSFSHLLKF